MGWWSEELEWCSVKRPRNYFKLVAFRIAVLILPSQKSSRRPRPRAAACSRDGAPQRDRPHPAARATDDSLALAAVTRHGCER